MEIQVRIEIQDSDGKTQKRLIVSVPEDITKQELVEGMRSYFPTLPDVNIDVLIEPKENHPLAGKHLAEGAIIILRPRSTKSLFRVIKEE